MRKLLLFLFLLVCGLSATAQELTDSIARRMALLAACDSTAELLPLYRQYGDSLPVPSRLFCNIAFARTNHNDKELLTCVDSLLQSYPRSLPSATRYSLSILKAEAMVRRSEFAPLATFCSQEMKRYRNKKKLKELYNGLKRFRDKGLRLSDDRTPRGRMLRAADRGDVFVLEPLYLTYKDSVDAYARLMSRLVLSRGSMPSLTSVETADSLMRFCADSLDHDGMETCLRATMQTYFNFARWKDLSDFCKKSTELYPEYADLIEDYRQVADGFVGAPAAEVKRPAHTCSIRTSLDWPLLTSIEINGKPLSNVIIDTGYPVTMISRDEATRCGVRVLADTLRVPSMFGTLTVFPAVVSDLRLGEIHLCHVPIYVADDDNESLSEDFTGLVGASALVRLGRVDFCPERMIVPYNPEPLKGERGLKLSDDGGLRIKAYYKDTDYLFAFDTGMQGSMLSNVVFPREKVDTMDFHLRANDVDIHLPYVSISDQKALDHVGIIGFPFLRSFGTISFDFTNMRFAVSDPKEFKYRSINDWINDGNLFRLERNLPSLSVVTDEAGELMANIFIDYGKDCPDTVNRKVDDLFAMNSDSRESATFYMVKLQALSDMGHYAEADKLLEYMFDHGYYHPAMEADLRLQRRFFKACSHLAPIQTRLAEDIVILPKVENKKTHEKEFIVSVNNRETGAQMDMTQTACILSQKLAKKLKVRILLPDYSYEGKPVAVGVIDRLKLGGAEAENVICYVSPDKLQPFTVGNRLLRRFSAVSIGENDVRLFADSPALSASAVPLRLDNGNLYVPAQSGCDEHVLRITSKPGNELSTPVKAPVTISLNTLPATDFSENAHAVDAFSTGTLSLPYLLQKKGTVTFDFRNMKLE